MAWYKIDAPQINTFKAMWPGHNLPDELEVLYIEKDQDQLVDIAAFSRNGETFTSLDTGEFDGTPLSALVDDCATLGEPSDGPYSLNARWNASF